LIGRERVLATVRDLILREDVPLFTLTGPSGVGKTRLALEAAAELSEVFADGI
jgi:predicted ATPase